MDKLLDLLPQYILYIAMGFVFLRIFRFTCIIKNPDKYEHTIWESLMIGFILFACYSNISFLTNDIKGIVLMITATVISSFLLAKIYSSHFVDKILRKIGVGRNKNKYIWQDLIDTSMVTYIKLTNPQTKEVYSGVVLSVQEFSDEPKIILGQYVYWKEYDDDIPSCDYEDNAQMVTLVDTSQFSRIEVSYQSGSKNIKHIKQKAK